MAPVAQNSTWSEILCCQICNNIFSNDRFPINLVCGHSACCTCLKFPPEECPHDHVAIQKDILKFPPNLALLSIISVNCNKNLSCNHKSIKNAPEIALSVETSLQELASYLRLAESEKGGAIFSDEISRTIQKKVISLLCTQIYSSDGRIQALRTIRSIVERVLTEISLGLQNNTHLSSYLWSAVRSRGCQFLGPAMQEDVLRLILLTLSKGELIARKTLVMYIVQTLSEDYPHVSKTCVGHVVQLLYRASCFNVIKRDGESSLMQLKGEFRNYEDLRREHDTQIVQIALEAGLRISPDQWSSLLYGDLHHQSHMQSLVDKLHSPQLLSNALQEFKTVIYRSDDGDRFLSMVPHLETIAKTDFEHETVDWPLLNNVLFALRTIMPIYVQFSRNRHNSFVDGKNLKKPEIGNVCAPLGLRLYKTRICRDISAGRTCPRGDRCTYAHTATELRNLTGARQLDFGQHNESDQQSSSTNVQQLIQNSSSNVQVDTSPIRFSTNFVQQQMFSAFDSTPMIIPGAQNVDQARLIVENNPLPIMPMSMVIGQPSLDPTKATAIGSAQMNQSMYMFQPQTQDPTLIQHVMMPNQSMALIPSGVNSAETSLLPGAIQPTAIVQPITVDQVIQPFQVFPVPVAAAPATTPPLPVAAPIWNYVDMSIPPPTTTLHFAPQHAQMLAANELNKISITACDRFGCDEHQRDGSEMPEEENLLLRRNEIINRLKEIDDSNDTLDDDLESHVSFTVANSVLYDDKDTRECRTSGIELPPLSLPDAPHPTSLGFTVAPSLMFGSITTTVRTVCPTTLLHSGSPRPATVQADCSDMSVVDVIHQPLVTSILQQKLLSPQTSYEMMDPSHLAEHLPKVIKPLPITPQDPQCLVATTLDRIVEVRAQINDAEKLGGQGSAVEKEQLKLEMDIVDRQISSLDKHTQHSCLLKELRAIDEKIENLNVNL